MILSLNLSPETEARLKTQALKSGKSPEELVLEALTERLTSDGSDSDDQITAKRRKQEFQAWLAAHPSVPGTNVDDSRESIYEGRGE